MTPVLLSSQNVGGGTAVVQVRATDRDAGINSVLSYYITEGNEDMTFRMDRISGEIATRPAPPDRERQAFYHLVVTVEDEGTPTLSVSQGRLRGDGGQGGPATCASAGGDSFLLPLVDQGGVLRKGAGCPAWRRVCQGLQ